MTKKCNKCGEEYEGYAIFIKNSIVTFSMYKAEKRYIDEHYDGQVCKDCRSDIRHEIFNEEELG